MVPVRALVWVSSLPDFFDMMVLRFRRRQLHERNISEHDLSNFFDKYGPSAHNAFVYAAHLDRFEWDIQRRCRNLSLSELRDIMFEAAILDLNHNLSHQVLVIAPKPDSPCFKHCVQFASPFIANLLYMPFTSNLLLKPRSSAAFSFQHCSRKVQRAMSLRCWLMVPLIKGATFLFSKCPSLTGLEWPTRTGRPPMKIQ